MVFKFYLLLLWQSSHNFKFLIFKFCLKTMKFQREARVRKYENLTNCHISSLVCKNIWRTMEGIFGLNLFFCILLKFSGTIEVHNVNVSRILEAVNIENHAHICNINKIKIQYCKKLAYGLYFSNAICNVTDLMMKNVTIKNSAVLIKTAKVDQKDDIKDDLQTIGRYLFNFRFAYQTYPIFPNNFTFDKISVTKSKMTSILELSNFNRPVMVNGGFHIISNQFQNGIEIAQSDFDVTNMELFYNDVKRNMLNHNKGTLSLTDVSIGENNATREYFSLQNVKTTSI